MNANEIKTVKNIRNYAKNYDAATALGLTEQAKMWKRKYEKACKLIGFDPLV